MGWGIDFTADIYLNKQSYSNKHEVEDKIKEINEDIQIAKEHLFLLVGGSTSLVSDEFKNDKAIYLHSQVSDILNELENCIVQRKLLYLYLDYLENNKTNDKEKRKLPMFLWWRR